MNGRMRAATVGAAAAELHCRLLVERMHFEG